MNVPILPTISTSCIVISAILVAIGWALIWKRQVHKHKSLLHYFLSFPYHSCNSWWRFRLNSNHFSLQRLTSYSQKDWALGFNNLVLYRNYWCCSLCIVICIVSRWRNNIIA